MLCQNRPEGLSTSSAISSPLPTQCFFDTVLVPLPTWIFFITIIPLSYVFRAPIPSSGTSRRWLRKSASGIYYFCIGVIVLMETVEVARLVQADLGVGLVPFVYAGCVVTVTLQATDGFRGTLKGWQISSMVFWLLGFCITTAKVAALARFGTKGPLARNETKYPVEHQLTDLAILIAFYAILAVMEVLLVVSKPSYKSQRNRPDDTLELNKIDSAR